MIVYPNSKHKTLKEALKDLKPGEILLVKAGTYDRT